MLCAEEFFSEPEKREQESELNGVHKIVYDLYRWQIQAQRERCYRAKRGGPAEGRKNSQHNTESDAQGDLFRRHSLAQQIQQRPDQLSIEKTFFHWSTRASAEKERPPCLLSSRQTIAVAYTLTSRCFPAP